MDEDEEWSMNVPLFQSDSAELVAACRIQIANMLINREAFVDAPDNRGRDPLQYGHTVVREGVQAFMRYK